MNKKLFFLLLLSYHLALAEIPASLNPEATCLIMKDQGLSAKVSTSGKLWYSYYENDYGCNSDYKKLKASSPYIFENNLAFYVNGNGNKINKIYLVLNINDKGAKTEAIKQLENTSSILYKRILKKELPAEFSKSIKNSKPLRKEIDGFNIEIKRDDWPTKKGYGLHFIIS